MLRPILGFAAFGVGTLIAFKLLTMVLPLIGLAIGAVLLGIKLLFVAMLIYVAYKMFQKAMKPRLEVE